VALGRAVARPEEEAARTRVSRWALEAANTAAPLVQGALEVAMALWRMQHQKANREKKRVDGKTHFCGPIANLCPNACTNAASLKLTKRYSYSWF
jgi:hypothetical protein